MFGNAQQVTRVFPLVMLNIQSKMTQKKKKKKVQETTFQCLDI